VEEEEVFPSKQKPSEKAVNEVDAAHDSATPRRRRGELACRARPSLVHHMQRTMVFYDTTCTRYANHTLSAHFLDTASHAPHTILNTFPYHPLLSSLPTPPPCMIVEHGNTPTHPQHLKEPVTLAPTLNATPSAIK
jgi:hypothetical protein